VDLKGSYNITNDNPSEPKQSSAGHINSVFQFLGLQLRPPGGLKEKFLAIFAVTILSTCSYLANSGMDGIKEFFFPDMVQERMQAAQKNIEQKVNNIEQISKSISDRISSVDDKVGYQIKSDLSLLKQAIDDLQPEIAIAGKIGGDAVRRFAEAKQNELESLGFSTSSDFLLSLGEGATVCVDGYVFGIRPAVGSVAIEASLSGGGKTITSAIQPGGSLVLEKPNKEIIQVAYQGRYVAGKEARYGFSVICPK